MQLVGVGPFLNNCTLQLKQSVYDCPIQVKQFVLHNLHFISVLSPYFPSIQDPQTIPYISK